MVWESSKTQPTIQSSLSTANEWMQSVSTPDPTLAPESRALLNEAQPVGGEFSQLLLNAMQGNITGGLGKIVGSAEESSKRATSKALQDLEDYIATNTGIGGTPFAAKERGRVSREGEFATSQIGPAVIAQLIQLIPSYLQGTREAGISGLAQARTTTTEQESRSITTAEGYGGGARSSHVGICGISFTASHGRPHPATRLYRDLCTRRHLRGYYFFAERIVPLMYRSRAFKLIVRMLITDPVTYYSKYYFGYSRWGFLCAPFMVVWRGFIWLLGSDTVPYRRTNREVI